MQRQSLSEPRPLGLTELVVAEYDQGVFAVLLWTTCQEIAISDRNENDVRFE
jgi:hypothetical protein